MLVTPQGMSYHALVESEVNMQFVKELLDEVFNSGKYSYATIIAYGGIQHRCAIGTTTFTAHDGYCSFTKTLEGPINVFEKDKTPKTAIETIFIDYSKIIEVLAIEKV